MAIIISLSKEEKFAILKFMIHINNFYNQVDERLPKGAEYIQKTANYLGVFNEMSVAYNLPQSTASSILEKALQSDYAKEGFVSKIFSILLLNKDTYGFKSFERHCDDAKYLTKFFLKRCHFSHYAKDPVSSSEYVLINDVATDINVDSIQDSSKSSSVKSLDIINETLYKDL